MVAFTSRRAAVRAYQIATSAGPISVCDGTSAASTMDPARNNATGGQYDTPRWPTPGAEPLASHAKPDGGNDQQHQTGIVDHPEPFFVAATPGRQEGRVGLSM